MYSQHCYDSLIHDACYHPKFTVLPKVLTEEYSRLVSRLFTSFSLFHRKAEEERCSWGISPRWCCKYTAEACVLPGIQQHVMTVLLYIVVWSMKKRYTTLRFAVSFDSCGNHLSRWYLYDYWGSQECSLVPRLFTSLSHIIRPKAHAASIL